jgi:hypothetical protein
MGHSRTVPRNPIDLSTLLSWVDDPRAIAHLSEYFEPHRPPGSMPRYSGSRFEFLAGGGDRPEAANRITIDDLVAVTLLSVDVPGDVALKLLEGQLGPDVARHLEHIPTDVSIDDPAAVELFSSSSHARVAWDLLEEPHGMGWVITNKLLARKRPQLIPVYDGVVQCAFGHPVGLWNWLLAMFAENGRVLNEHLLAARAAAEVSSAVSPLRILDVIVWMRHRPNHMRSGCRGAGL